MDGTRGRRLVDQMDSGSNLLCDIYSSPTRPEYWKQVLEHLVAIADADGAVLFSLGSDGVRWISTRSIERVVDEWADSEWSARNERARRLLARADARFLTDLDVFSISEIEGEPFYRDFLRPRGLGWCVCTALPLAGERKVFVSIERAFEKGPVAQEAVDALDRVRPHLKRAARIASHMAGSRLRATLDALELVGVAAAAVTADGLVVDATQQVQQMGHVVSVSPSNHLRFASQTAQKQFRDCLATLTSLPGAARMPPIVSVADNSNDAIVARCLPFRLFGQDVFQDVIALVAIRVVNRRVRPDERLLKGLFRLTSAEAVIASLLAQGETVEEVARRRGVEQNTIRVQLKGIFDKTGTRRQSELVGLITQTSGM